MSEHPRSSSILNNMLMKTAAKHPGLVPKVLRKGFITTIVAQMLPKGAFLKGGSALALRYPLTEARSSRDVDSTFTTSMEEFLTEFRGNLQEGWHGFTGTCEVEYRHHPMPRRFLVVEPGMPECLPLRPVHVCHKHVFPLVLYQSSSSYSSSTSRHVMRVLLIGFRGCGIIPMLCPMRRGIPQRRLLPGC